MSFLTRGEDFRQIGLGSGLVVRTWFDLSGSETASHFPVFEVPFCGICCPPGE